MSRTMRWPARSSATRMETGLATVFSLSDTWGGRRVQSLTATLRATISLYDLRGGTMIKEFRDFISRGNVLDLAVAVIIGGAFGAITTSLVNEVIMPVVGLVLG